MCQDANLVTKSLDIRTEVITMRRQSSMQCDAIRMLGCPMSAANCRMERSVIVKRK